MNSNRSFLWWSATIALAIVVLVWMVLRESSIAEPLIEGGMLTDLQAAQLDYYRERCALFVSLCTLLAGAAAAIQRGTNHSAQTRRIATLSGIAAILGVIFGYMGYDTVLWMLEKGFVSMSVLPITLPAHLQLTFAAFSLVGLLAAVSEQR